MGTTTVRIGGNATQVTVRGGAAQRVTLDRRTVAAIANNRPTTVVQPGVTPVAVTLRDTVVRAGSAMGAQGPQGDEGNTKFTAIAMTDLTYPRIVAVVDGVAHYADPTSRSDLTSQMAVTTQAAVAGQPVICATRFTHTESAWNWPSGRVYLADVPGQLASQPAAAAVLEVARATSPTILDFNIQTALLRM
jgi:hypothetical protein